MTSTLMPPLPGAGSLTCRLLVKFISRHIADEAFTLIDHLGNEHHGGAKGPPPAIVVRLTTSAIERRLLMSPQLAFGEGFTDGSILIEKGSLREALEMLLKTQRIRNEIAWFRDLPGRAQIASLLAGLLQWNSTGAARRNAKHSYDIGNHVFERFLDPTMQYTCAYFPDDVSAVGEAAALAKYHEQRRENLDVAQQRKLQLIIDKLCIRDGMRILDVGCGWGGLALEIAKRSKCDVLGVSLSKEQVNYAKEKAATAGLSKRLRYELLDYRQASGIFDRIVGVGVLEHVGKPNFRTFFRCMDQLLAPDGIFLLHTIGRIDRPGGTNPWLDKYIFPGGYIPAMSEIVRAYESTRMMLSDVEVLKLHYAFTLREWCRRFDAAAEDIQSEMGERFVRMFRFYLIASELSFIYGRFVNYQIQFVKNRFTLPITREYLSKHGNFSDNL